jgi:hypothetical protein
MTREQIDSVLERVRSWPAARQEDAVQLLLALEAQGSKPYVLSDEERADLDEALEELTRGEVASDGEVAAVFDRYRR